MEKQEFCMEKSQIFQEMISRISKLSQDSYLMVTDMQHNLTFVPESTAEFLGIPSGWCEDGYKIVLEKSVHPYDCPEYTEEMKKRLRGINLENDLYIRMGKDKKYVMTQIITDMILEQGKNRYFIVLLRNQNVIPEIDPLTDLYGQVKFEKDIVDYIQQGRKVAVLEIEIDHMNDINILYGTNYSDRIQKSGCKVSRKYEIEGGIESLLENFNAEDLFSHIEGNPDDVIDTPNETKDYKITIDYKKSPQRVIEGSYDKNGLPEDFADFAETVFDFICFYGMGEIFDPSVYGKVKRCQSEYIFCSVTFDEEYKSYYYLTNDDSIEVGDFVIVPAGKDNHEAVVEVVNIEYFNDENAPLPAEKTKRIIRKCTDDDFDPPVE